MVGCLSFLRRQEFILISLWILTFVGMGIPKQQLFNCLDYWLLNIDYFFVFFGALLDFNILI